MVDKNVTKFSKSRVWDKVPEGSRSTLTLQRDELLFNTMQDKSRVASIPKYATGLEVCGTVYRHWRSSALYVFTRSLENLQIT